MELNRYKQNPILEPIKDNEWESRAVFNCGAAYDKDKKLIHVLYRAIGWDKDYISRVGYASFKIEGNNLRLIQRKDKPVFEPVKDYEIGSCEDPRITEIEGRFYMVYAALSTPPYQGGTPPMIALASTTDFVNFKRHGIITPEGADDRDAVLFPEKVNGKYVMLHRPYNWTKECIYEKQGKLYLKVKEKTIKWPLKEVPDYFPKKPSIWIAYSDNLKDWFGHKAIMEPETDWECVKIGAGPPPLKTEKGWLLFYHGVSYEDGVRKYKTGAALLDLKEPAKIIGRSKKPILEPKERFEIEGDVNNVVFLEGAVIIGDEVKVFYGAADKVCCLATYKVHELVDYLLKGKS